MKKLGNVATIWFMGSLISSLDRYVANSVMYFNTARDIRLDLEGHFGKTSSQIYYFQEKLLNTFQEPGMTLATYV